MEKKGCFGNYDIASEQKAFRTCLGGPCESLQACFKEAYGEDIWKDRLDKGFFAEVELYGMGVDWYKEE